MPQPAPDQENRAAQAKSRRKRLLLILLLLILTLGTALWAIDTLLAYTLCRGGRWEGPASDHFDGERFFNLEATRTFGSGSGIKWLLGAGERGHYPTVAANEHRPELAPEVDGADWECTMINHATVLIRMGGLNILTDPVWSNEVSPVAGIGPSRHRPAGIAWDELPRIDVCLLSHDHYDHFDVATLRRLQQRDKPLFIVPLGMRALLEYHIGEARIAERDWWQTVQLKDLAVTLTPAHHWSNRYRGSRNRNRSLWCGFWIEKKAGPAVYFAGDTAMTRAFGDIRQRLGRADLAIIPIGAYKPDWLRSHHISPDEALQAFRTLGAREALGCHFGTWQLGYEGYNETLQDLAAARGKYGISADRFRAAENGRSYRGRAARRRK